MKGLSRRQFLGSAVATASLTATAFAQPNGGAERPLRMAAATPLVGPDPVSSSYVIQNLEIGETLLDVGANGTLQPRLAAAVEMSDDGLSWRLDLRPDARFHDGTAITADAVVTTLKRLHAMVAAPFHQVPLTSIEGADGAVSISLSRPFMLLPAYLATASSMILAPGSYAADGTVRRIVGSGPYRVARLRDNNTLDIQAVRSVAQGGPAIQAAVYQAVVDPETRARMLESGDVDIAYTVSPVAADRLRRNARMKVVSNPGPRLRYVMVNAVNPALADLRVRQALSLALDRAGAARVILRNPAAAATQMMPPVLPDWTVPGASPLTYDGSAAEQRLDDAGWVRGKDGVRHKGGERLSFSLDTYPWRPELPPLAEVLQAQWRKIGVETTIEIMTPERILQKSRSGSLQLALMSRSYFVVPDIVGTLAEDFVAGAPGRGWGAVGWSSPELENAIAAYEATADETIRAQSRATILRIVHHELPIIPHSWYDYMLGHSAAVQDVVADPFETNFRLSRMRWR